MKIFRRTPKPVDPAAVAQNLGDDTQHAVGCGFCGRRMGHQIGCPAAG